MCQSVVSYGRIPMIGVRGWLGLLLLAGAQTIQAAEPVVADSSPTDVRFTSRHDGTEQQYVLISPAKFDRKVPVHVLMALHGHGSDRWQFVKDQRGECKAARDAAAKHGFLFIAPDYRAKTSWMGPAATEDIRQILDDLRKEFRIGKVIISGGSMGGTSAVAFAAMHPRSIDGVVSLNGTANMLEYAQFTEALAASYGGTRTDKPHVYRERSAELFPERLTMPTAFTTGGQDTLVPPDSTLRLVERLQQRQAPVHLIHRPDGGHATNYEDSLAAFEFVIDRVLRTSK